MNAQEHDLPGRIAATRVGVDYEVETVIDRVTEAIVDRMLELGLNRKELAGLVGVSPARISTLLRGSNNYTVQTLVEVSRALDCSLSVTLLPHRAQQPAAYSVSASATRAPEAAEARATYRPARTSTHATRDGEIRAHLASGKLKVDGDRVYMRHESDASYRPAKFRKAGTHSDMEKTNVGRRAYYRDRILAVARELGRSG